MGAQKLYAGLTQSESLKALSAVFSLCCLLGLNELRKYLVRHYEAALITALLISLSSPILSEMHLAAVCSQDLEPIAATLFKEAQICATLASQQLETWDPEASQLIANTYSSGISQVAHILRALQLEAIAMEQAAALNPA